YDRRPRAEERGRAPEDEELRQEVAERDQDDPRGDESVSRHAPRRGGARAPPGSARTRLRDLTRAWVLTAHPPGRAQPAGRADPRPAPTRARRRFGSRWRR